MPRAITFDSRLRTRSFCKHASTYSVRKIALAVATSKTSRWIDTLLGQTYDGFWIYHEDLCDTSVRTMHPEKSKAVPLYPLKGLDVATWRNTSSSSQKT